MQHNHASPLVVKYGGAALGAGALRGQDPILLELAALRAAGRPVVLVHGGGPEIDRRLAERGIATERIDGQRVTDKATLETVEAVLCGTLNKRLVRACLALRLPAVGISGQDGRLLVAEKAVGTDAADFGFVGTVVECNDALVRCLLAADFVPVVAPLAVASDGSHAFNVNADFAAAALAASLRACAFVAITDVARVLRDPDDSASGIDRLTPDEARRFAASDACRSSMKPKLLAAVAAVAGGAAATYICKAKPNAIAAALAGDATIVRA